MTVSVYEVEIETGIPGYRVLQHVLAESADEAEAKVAEIQKAEVKKESTSIWRESKPKEEAVFLEAKAARIAAEEAQAALETGPTSVRELP